MSELFLTPPTADIGKNQQRHRNVIFSNGENHHGLVDNTVVTSEMKASFFECIPGAFEAMRLFPRVTELAIGAYRKKFIKNMKQAHPDFIYVDKKKLSEIATKNLATIAPEYVGMGYKDMWAFTDMIKNLAVLHACLATNQERNEIPNHESSLNTMRKINNEVDERKKLSEEDRQMSLLNDMLECIDISGTDGVE